MVEWSITAVLKTAVPRGTGGSNPSLSAQNLKRNPLRNQRVLCFYTCLFISLHSYLTTERIVLILSSIAVVVGIS